MGGLTFSFHPLFFAFGFYYALTGRIFVFIIYTLSALAHELGHSCSAQKRGYKLNKITLMPFGAVCKGDVEGLNFTDQSAIALAGPLVNLAIGIFFVATWWISPETYAFTDVVAEANFSMAIVNCIPVFPLDGGRILQSSLSQKFGSERAGKICRITGIVFALLLLGLFIFSLFYTFNLSLLFFSAFVFFGAICNQKENRYVRLFYNSLQAKLKKGVIVKTFGVDKSVTVMALSRILDYDCLNEVVVYDEGKKIGRLSNERVLEILGKGDIYSPVSTFL